MSESKAQPPRKPRNSLLSAYYGLSADAPSDNKDTEKLGNTALSSSSQPLTHLTQTLPLSDLLLHSKRLRESSLSTQASLQSATRLYYSQLISSSKTSAQASELITSLQPSLSSLFSTLSDCNSINTHLSEARADVDKLDASRRVALLKSAAQALTRDLEPAYHALVDLCTDPQGATRSLFIVARRIAVVLPAVQGLKDVDKEFEDCAGKLEEAVCRVRLDMGKREGERYGMGIVDEVRLRRLLGEHEDMLRDVFFGRVGREITAIMPKETGEGGKEYVEWAGSVLVGKLESVERKFGEAFEGREWEEFVVWVSDLLDECVAGKVRRGVKGGEVERVGDILVCVEGLKGGEGRVGGVVREMVDGLKVGVLGEVKRERDRRWKQKVESIVEGEGAGEGVGDLVRRVTEVGIEWEEVIKYAVDTAEDQMRKMGRVGWMMTEVGKRVGGDMGGGIRKMGERMLERVREEVMGSIEIVLRRRVRSLSGLGDDSPRSSAAQIGDVVEAVDVGKVVKLILEANEIGEECGLKELSIGRRLEKDFLLGEEDSLTGVVAVAWIEIIREGWFASEAGVHALQLDAREVGEGVGAEEAFERIPAEALGRCEDAEAVLLREGEVLEACRQRAAVRG